jgi:DNA replication protein DnaC
MHSDNREFQRSVVAAIGSKNTILRTCDIHGQYSASVFKLGGVERESPCPACFEAGRSKRIRAAQIEFENERKRHREKLEQRRMEEKTGAARIPKRFQGKTFADYIAETPPQQRALEACTSYAHNFADNLAAGRCLILSGNVGTGKTHLAAAIADYIVRETEYTAVFRSLHSILQAIKSTYGGDAGFTESDVLQLFTDPDLLIIDEVGATKSSEFEIATLFAIINTRYENNLPTVVITNLEAAELKSAIGDRCTDRLREGGGRVIAFNWESKRSVI